MHRRPMTSVAVLAALTLVLAACSGGAPELGVVAAQGAAGSPSAPAAASVVSPSAHAPAAVPSSAVASPAASASSSPAASSAASPAASRAASPAASTSPSPERPSYDVTAAQRTLARHGYYAGAVDGRPGPALRSAVMAFQKVQGLGADGVVGPATLRALADPRRPVLRAAGPAHRVEVDLTRQVLYVVEGGVVRRVLPVSSGNGATYRQKSGGTARALTPVGWYTVQRRIVGVRNADLGTLYDPQYFYKGWAIHGSNSVPAGPASHGCVRVTRADAKYLLGAISVGTRVFLYGGAHTFQAGSGAPGTDSPTGDTPQDAPTAAPSPSTSPVRSPSAPRTSGPTSRPTSSPASAVTASPSASRPASRPASPTATPSPSRTAPAQPTSSPTGSPSGSPAGSPAGSGRSPAASGPGPSAVAG